MSRSTIQEIHTYEFHTFNIHFHTFIIHFHTYNIYIFTHSTYIFTHLTQFQGIDLPWSNINFQGSCNLTPTTFHTFVMLKVNLPEFSNRSRGVRHIKFIFKLQSQEFIYQGQLSGQPSVGGNLISSISSVSNTTQS